MNPKKILTMIAQLPLDGDEVGVKKDDGSVDFVEKDKAEDLEKCDEDLEEDFDDFPRDVEMANPVDDFEMGTDEYGLQQLEGNITGRVSELKNLLKRYIQTCNKMDVLDDHSRSCQNEFMDLLGKLNDTVVFESELNPKELWKNDLEKFYNFVYKDKD